MPRAAAALKERFAAAAAAAAAAKNAEYAAEEVERAVDALKLLRDAKEVSADVLVETQLGKEVRALKKSHAENAAIVDAVGDVLQRWKEVVAASAAAAEGEKPKAAAASEASAPPSVGNAVRDAFLKKFADALATAREELGAGAGSAPPPSELALRIEKAMFDKFDGALGKEYKDKGRSLAFNLSDKKNPDLRRRVASGAVSPDRLPHMTPDELASDALKEEKQSIRDHALFECERGQIRAATTDAFRCGKCGQRRCSYYQMQTRSADEPMTTFVTCLNCNNRWKFS